MSPVPIGSLIVDLSAIRQACSHDPSPCYDPSPSPYQMSAAAAILAAAGDPTVVDAMQLSFQSLVALQAMMERDPRLSDRSYHHPRHQAALDFRSQSALRAMIERDQLEEEQRLAALARQEPFLRRLHSGPRDLGVSLALPEWARSDPDGPSESESDSSLPVRSGGLWQIHMNPYRAEPTVSLEPIRRSILSLAPTELTSPLPEGASPGRAQPP
jgi:hypothetical protein